MSKEFLNDCILKQNRIMSELQEKVLTKLIADMGRETDELYINMDRVSIKIPANESFCRKLYVDDCYVGKFDGGWKDRTFTYSFIPVTI